MTERQRIIDAIATALYCAAEVVPGGTVAADIQVDTYAHLSGHTGARRNLPTRHAQDCFVADVRRALRDKITGAVNARLNQGA